MWRASGINKNAFFKLFVGAWYWTAPVIGSWENSRTASGIARIARIKAKVGVGCLFCDICVFHISYIFTSIWCDLWFWLQWHGMSHQKLFVWTGNFFGAGFGHDNLVCGSTPFVDNFLYLLGCLCFSAIWILLVMVAAADTQIWTHSHVFNHKLPLVALVTCKFQFPTRWPMKKNVERFYSRAGICRIWM